MEQRTLVFSACAIQRCTWALTWRLCNLSLFYAGGMLASCAMLLRNNMLLSATRCFAKLRARGVDRRERALQQVPRCSIPEERMTCEHSLCCTAVGAHLGHSRVHDPLKLR